MTRNLGRGDEEDTGGERERGREGEREKWRGGEMEKWGYDERRQGEFVITKKKEMQKFINLLPRTTDGAKICCSVLAYTDYYFYFCILYIRKVLWDLRLKIKKRVL